MSRLLTRDTIGRSIIIVLAIVLTTILFTLFNTPTQAQSYSLDLTFTEMWDVSAPCFNSGNCTFSCNAANVGRTCYTNICNGLGNGATAYLDHSEYVCNYYPPAACDTDQIGVYPDCRYPTCADDPTLDGCSCSATNACGATNNGTYSAGSCSATAPALPPGYGTSCSVSNSCGSLTNYGTIQCDGSCSAPAPSEDSCPPSCVPTTGSSCNVNACGVAGGTVQCDGSCSGGTPAVVDACPSDAGLQCSGPCAGGGGGGGVSANLSASPTTISPGGSSTLTWTSTNATSCSGINFSTGGAPNGTTSVSPAATTGYTATCTNGSENVSDTETVTVLGGGGGGGCSDTGPIDASSTPDRITPGDSVTLTWLGSNTAALSCTLTNLNTGSILKTTTVTSCSFSDSATTGPVNAQTTYRLECGSLTKDVTVNVVPRFEEF